MSHRMTRHVQNTFGRDHKRAPHFPDTVERLDDAAEDVVRISVEWIIVAFFIAILVGMTIGLHIAERDAARFRPAAEQVAQ